MVAGFCRSGVGVISVRGANAAASIDLGALDVEPEVLRRIPRVLALRYNVLMLSVEGNVLTVALPDLDDQEAIERVRLATGMHVRAVVAPREAIREKLHALYSPYPAESTDEAPAIRVIDGIHERAVRAFASDVHIEPMRSGGTGSSTD